MQVHYHNGSATLQDFSTGNWNQQCGVYHTGQRSHPSVPWVKAPYIRCCDNRLPRPCRDDWTWQATVPGRGKRCSEWGAGVATLPPRTYQDAFSDVADSENRRCGTGTLYADLRVSAVSVVPAGGYLAYRGSPTCDTTSTTVDILRAILAVSGCANTDSGDTVREVLQIGEMLALRYHR